MANVAKKARETAVVAGDEQKTAKVARAGLPTGVKIADGHETPLDAASIRKVMEGWEVKRLVDDAKARLDAINAELIAAHGTGCALVVTGICRASLASRQTVKVTDPDQLEAVLGGRYLDLVREEVSYKAEPRLIKMAASGDEPLAPALRACLAVSASESVTWRAEK